MKLLTSSTIWIVVFFCLSGCNRLIQGAPQPAPTDVSVVNGDTSAIVNWTTQPGNQYFIYWDNGSNVTIDSCSSSPTCTAAAFVSPPFVITGLVDGQTYSVTVNARTEGAKGGPGSPPKLVSPQQAGASTTWSPGNPNPVGTYDLLGLTYGTYIFNSPVNNLGSGYVAVGANGALDYGIVGGNGILNWTPILGNPLPSITLYGVAYSDPIYVAVGASGNILYSSDRANTWTQLAATTTTTTTAATLPACTLTTPTACDLYSIYSNHAGFFIAAGANGRILYSSGSGGVNWSLPTNLPAITNNLRSITFGDVTYVAVGDSGALLTSPDANNWINLTSPSITSANLTGVAYGYVTSISATTGVITQTPTFVAVGSGGEVLTGTYNTSGVLQWSPHPISLNPNLTAVTYGIRTGGNALTQNIIASEGQFIAADSVGNVYTSSDGVTWSTAQSLTAFGGTQSINAIAAGPYDYTVVGAGGLNMNAL